MESKMKLMAMGAMVAALTLASACTDNNQRAGMQNDQQSGQTTGQTSSDTSKQSSNEQVVQDQTQLEQAGRLGQAGQTTGKESVSGKREVITKKTERVNEKIPTVVEGTQKADINRMEEKDFMALGLSQSAAKQIVDYRKQHGNFASINDLKNVPGINQSWLNSHMSKLGISQSAGQAGSDNQ